jgi:excisionase family DNA binding protein
MSAVESPGSWVAVHGFLTRSAAQAAARRLRWRAARADPALPAGRWQFRVNGSVLEAQWLGDAELAASQAFASWWSSCDALLVAGPLLIVRPGAQAHRLAARWRRCLEEDRARGVDLAAEDLALLADLDRLVVSATGRVGRVEEPEPVTMCLEMSTTDAARKLGCSERHVRRLCEDGALGSRKVSGRRLVDVESVLTLAAEREAGE